MAEQTELTCVSCDTTFDPSPNGGFCPDCDTPHPDYAQQDPDDDGSATDDSNEPDAAAEPEEGAEDDVSEAADAGEPEDAEIDEADEAETDESPAVCPECGAVLDEEAEAESDEGAEEESGELSECPDCGHSITDESFCPNCGTDLDAIRDDAAADSDDGAADAEDEAAADAAEAADEASEDGDSAAAVTVVIDGESYGFDDGDTFGRQDEDWLEDLVAAAGGPDDVAYISGDHIEFSVEEDGVYVRDVSRNGTTLNGTELDGGKERIEDGDTLVLAERAEVEVAL